jgi:hypothetical protein
MNIPPSLLTLTALISFTTLAHAGQVGAQHRLLVANGKTVAVVTPDGSIERELKTSGLHDVSYLPNGNILFQSSWTRVAEADPKGNIVWEYDCATSNGNTGKPLEVHAFQRLENGVTMIAESGIGRIIEVDREGRLLHSIQLKVDRPSKHRDTRLVRRTPQGTYLVSHEGDGKVREYARDGKVIWEYAVPLFDRDPKGGHGPEAFGNQTFASIRLDSGNTLITTGNGHRVIEVNKAGDIVWQLTPDDVPGIALGWITRVERLSNGNTRFGNCHAGPGMPLSIEVSPAKKVVWSYEDFTRFGNATVAVDVIP